MTTEETEYMRGIQQDAATLVNGFIEDIIHKKMPRAKYADINDLIMRSVSAIAAIEGGFQDHKHSLALNCILLCVAQMTMNEADEHAKTHDYPTETAH